MLAFLILIYVTPVQAWQNVVSNDYSYKFVSNAVVSTIKSQPGFLHALTIGGGTTSTFDIYDGAQVASNLMYSFTTTSTLGTTILDVRFTSGCTIVTNGGAIKYTVSYQ